MELTKGRYINMARTILTVNATQVVTSQANPRGIMSIVSGYPKVFDSKDYNDDLELTMRKAKADYFDRLGVMYDDTNENRIMKTVTLEVADGHQILHESVGSFLVLEQEEETEEPVGE